MSQQSDQVRSFISACESRDFATALAMLTTDVEYDNVPVGKVYGPSAVRDFLSSGLAGEADEIEWTILRQASDGDLVLNERLDRFLVRGTWVEIAVAGVFELRDGRIGLWRDYFDLETWKKQIARLPKY